MRLITLSVFWLLIFNNKVSAFSDTIKALQYHTHADTMWHTPDTCLKYTKLAIPLLEKVEYWDKYQYNLNTLSYTYSQLDRFDDMLSNNLFAYEEAKKRFPKNHYHYHGSMNNLGLALFFHERNDEAIELYKRVLNDIDSSFVRFHLLKGTIYSNIGNALMETGEYNLSLSYYKRASKDLWKYYGQNEKTLGNSWIRIARLHQSIAKAYQYLSKFGKAENELLLAIEMINKNPELKDGYSIRVSCQLISIYISQNKYYEARQLIIKVKSNMNISELEKSLLFNLEGDLFMLEESFAKASETYEKAIIYTSNASFVDRIKTLAKLSEVHSKMENHASSEIVLTESYNLLQLGNGQEYPLVEFDLNEISLKNYKRLKSGKEYSNSEINKLTTLITNNLEISKKVSSTLTSQVSLNEYLGKLKEFNEFALEYLHEVYSESENQDLIECAFSVIENSKAVQLSMDLFQRAQLSQESGVVEYLDRINKYNVKINQFKRSEGKLLDVEKMDSSRLERLSDSIFIYQTYCRDIKDSVRMSNNDYHKLLTAETMPLIELDDVTNRLYLNYFVGDSSVYVVKTDGIKSDFFKAGNLDEINQAFLNLASNLKYNAEDQKLSYLSSANFLLQKLIGQDLGDYSEMVISPDGILYELPFSALSISDSTPDFLVSHISISYVYSFTSNQISSQDAKDVIHAPVVIDEYHESSQNKWKDFEFLQIGAISSDEEIKGVLSKFDFLFLSSHASSFDDKRKEPILILKNDTIGFSDVSSLFSGSRMIILSACETNIGDYIKGEGSMSLSRAFVQLGTPTISSTLWKVNGNSTENIYSNLVQNIQGGNSISKSLSDAQLDYLDTAPDHAKSPYYWAGLTVYGNSDPLQFGDYFSTFSSAVIVGFLAIILTFSFFFFHKR